MKKMKVKKCSSGCKQLFVDGEYWGHAPEDKADEIAERFWRDQRVENLVKDHYDIVNTAEAIFKLYEPKPLKVGDMQTGDKFTLDNRIHIIPHVTDAFLSESPHEVLTYCIPTNCVVVLRKDTPCEPVPKGAADE